MIKIEELEAREKELWAKKQALQGPLDAAITAWSAAYNELAATKLREEIRKEIEAEKK